ncbi:MAG: EAL domain-containing protein [Ferrovum myxofaciens]|nr:EAL domain-containing protein [Ferrovum myxofaciens]QKE41681.1 MAG: EAL domain-containing protein [Ferrovum myxofaciens]
MEQPDVDLDESDAFYIETDLDGIITYVNDTFVKMSGFPRNELIGENLNIVHHPYMPQWAFEDLWKTGILGYAERLCNNLEIPPKNVVFERLERDAISDMTSMRKFLTDLGKKGFSFAIDDFGSGYNSFHYLRELRFDYVKIDGAFVGISSWHSEARNGEPRLRCPAGKTVTVKEIHTLVLRNIYVYTKSISYLFWRLV